MQMFCVYWNEGLTCEPVEIRPITVESLIGELVGKATPNINMNLFISASFTLAATVTVV